MKSKIALCLSALLFSLSAQALSPDQNELAKVQWQDLNLNQQQTATVTAQAMPTIQGVSGAAVGYKIPANQGAVKIQIKSPVQKDNSVFVPNVLVLDSHFTPSLTYPAKQFQFAEERGLSNAQYQAELSLTPTPNQDFIYLLIYTTEQDLQGKTIMTHPAKLLAKAKGNQPPAIADIEVTHRDQGKVIVEVDGVQSSQFIGLSGPLFESKQPAPKVVGTQAIAKTEKTASKATQPVESSTEQYFNNAVKQALKNNDINKAMNLVNEAEQLGLKQPRQIFIKHVSAK